ncbi:DUF3102 domain-containing protein [Devosia epidermidihirudinis]|uniref:DUF3102 domain-containing protein n=1 Tax=Devosia epidermidihirudinis TaxID=1293439 RepID=UPI000AF3FF71|nr:DUF3102 domain-containing protein [Devosia epidermidihirudinis]
MNTHPGNLLALDGETAHYVGLIQSHLEKTLQGFIEIGRILTEAKHRLGASRWLDMINNDLPFTRRTAEKLIKIAADARLTDPRYANKLPPHWTSLHELTYLDDEQFEQGIADGIIRPDAERKEISGLKTKAAILSNRVNSTKSQSRNSASKQPQHIAPDVGTNEISLCVAHSFLQPAQVHTFETQLAALFGQFRLEPQNLEDFTRRLVLAGIERRLKQARQEFRHGLDGNDVTAIEKTFFELETKNAVAGQFGDSDHSGLELDELYNYCLDLQIVTKYTPVEFLNPQAYVDLLGWRYLTGNAAEQEAALEGLTNSRPSIPEAKEMLAYLVDL